MSEKQTIDPEETLELVMFEIPHNWEFRKLFPNPEHTIYFLRIWLTSDICTGISFFTDSWGKCLPSPKTFSREFLDRLFIYHKENKTEEINAFRYFGQTLKQNIKSFSLMILPKTITSMNLVDADSQSLN